MLNLVTATLTVYDSIVENRDKTPTDFAIVAYYIRKCNDSAWLKTDVVTSIKRLNGVTGSRTNYVKAALKRLQDLELIQVKRRQENVSHLMDPSEKICLKAGEKLRQLNAKKPTTTMNKNKSRTPQKTGDDS